MSTDNLSILANPFQFSQRDIRTAVDVHGEVWFCAKDVFEALEISWEGSGKNLRSYPENWVCTGYLPGQRGVGEVIFIAEPGVYRAVFRSNKPEAVTLANWVFEEVLPAIRKQGFFGTVDGSQRLAYSRQIVEVATRLVNTRDALLYQLLSRELRNLCNLIGEPMPALKLLGQDYKQMALFDEGGAA
jgi:prophage antirepressor-like protein